MEEKGRRQRTRIFEKSYSVSPLRPRLNDSARGLSGAKRKNVVGEPEKRLDDGSNEVSGTRRT